MNRRYIPNALTCGNLICGCIATGAGFHHHFTTAFIFIILGAVFDFFDGFAARLLNAPSKMGIELDSLADDVTFGVAPSAMIFTLFTEVRYPAETGPFVNIVDTLDVQISLQDKAPNYRFADKWSSFKSVEDAHLLIVPLGVYIVDYSWKGGTGQPASLMAKISGAGQSP